MVESAQWADAGQTIVNATIDGVEWSGIRMNERSELQGKVQAWIEAGDEPDPYVAPEPVPPAPTSEQAMLYDHENRIRAQEGLAPLTMAQFVSGAVADAGAGSKKVAPKKMK